MPGSMGFSMKGVEELISAIQRMAGAVTPEMYRSMDDAGNQAEQIMKENVPYRTGSLQASITHETEEQGNKIVVHIGPDDGNFDDRPVGIATELGRSPGGGFPNWYDIASRYGVSLGVAYAIAKKIQSDGSAGLGYGQKTIASVQPNFYEHGIQAMLRIAGKFK